MMLVEAIMPRWAYILIAVAIIVVLIAIFFITFFIYRRTPAPKGCENIHPDGESCKGCTNTMCEFHKDEYMEENKDTEERKIEE